MSTESDQSHGAYGLRLRGLEQARPLLVPAEDDWPAFELVNRVEPGPYPDVERVSSTGASLRLQTGGRVEIDREAGRATYVTPRPLGDDDLVHPYLAPVAGVVAWWLGRESFHAGAFVVDGAVYGVLGDRESGKSSTLAWLAGLGYGVICDDLLVIESGDVFVGPRSIDLRADASERLGLGEALGVVGARERWRFVLPQLDGARRLAGWITLEWSDSIEVAPLPASRRVLFLEDNRAVRLPSRNPPGVLELAAAPGWAFRRPKQWESLPEAVERLLEAVTR
jgi:hypothetical protein